MRFMHILAYDICELVGEFSGIKQQASSHLKSACYILLYLLLGPFLRHSRLYTTVVSSFYLQKTDVCAHWDLDLLCVCKQCKTCHLAFLTRQKFFTQHTVGHSKFSVYLAHTGLNSTYMYGSNSITEQWFTTYALSYVGTCYNLRHSSARDLNSSIYTVIHACSHINIR